MNYMSQLKRKDLLYPELSYQIVGILFEVAVGVIIEPLDNEIIANAISILISTLLIMYTSAVLALAIPLDELSENPSKRHMHRMGMKR